MNALFEKAKAIAAELTPSTAKHPKTGKWFAVDRSMGWTVGEPKETKAAAEQEWRTWKATDLASTAAMRSEVKGGGFSGVE